MPGPTKRTRQTTGEENETTPTPIPSTPAISRSSMTTRQRSPVATTPPVTPSRPIYTRSAATTTTTTQPTTPSHLTRSNSLFITPTPTTRRGLGGATSGSIGMGAPTAPIVTGRGGTLTRTQSTPSMAMASPDQLKAVAGGSGGSGRGKGDPEGGDRNWGKGKENIPPKKEDAPDAGSEGSRKRIRVGSRSSGSGRGRSDSISSMRSDSGRPSLCPTSSSSSFSFRTSRMISPTPSQATTQSFDSITSSDPLDLLHDQDDMDIDQTPTKPRPSPRRAATLPTPPPSSPLFRRSEMDFAITRMGMVRMESDRITMALEEEDTDVEDDGPMEIRKVNPYKHLKSFLRLSNTSHGVDTIVGREEEKASLRTYLSSKDIKDVGLYISGPPGTGKTATTTALGRELKREGWQVVELGCMGLKVVDVWRRLSEGLGCGKTEGEVKAYLEREGSKTLIILDEIDSLLPAAPATPPPAISHLLSKLFSLPLGCTSSTTKLVAISNTLDLILRANLVLPGNLQPLVLPFKAYVGSDMISIINARIVTSTESRAENETAKIEAKAIELLTKKVENQNGDLRVCLASLTSAVTLAEAEWTKKRSASLLPDSTPLIKISLPHTIKAFNSHTQQLRAAAGCTSAGSLGPTARKIKSVPLQGKMVLVSILLFVSRVKAGLPGNPAANLTPPSTPSKSNPTSAESLTANNLYATYSHLLSHHSSPFPPAAESDYRDLLSNLEVLGLISLGAGSGAAIMSRTNSNSNSSGRGRGGGGGGGAGKIILCVRDDEIRDGLGLGEGKERGMAEEEVKRVWEREEGRVIRAVERVKAREVRVEEGLGEV